VRKKIAATVLEWAETHRDDPDVQAIRASMPSTPSTPSTPATPAKVQIHDGELPAAVVKAFVMSLVGQDTELCEAVQRKAELLQNELLGDTATPVERLLVERVVSYWLQVQQAELQYAQLPADAYDDVEVCLRRLGAANRCFLAALRSLAQVRKNA
jgi:hypothetical protein